MSTYKNSSNKDSDSDSDLELENNDIIKNEYEKHIKSLTELKRGEWFNYF